MGGKVKEPKTKGKRGRMSNAVKEKKLNQLVSIVENGYYSEFTNIGLARHLEVTRQTLDRFKLQIKDKINEPQLELIKVDLISNYNKLRRRLHSISEKIQDLSDMELEKGDDKPEYIILELKVLKQIDDTIKSYVLLLESFGVKQKVAEKHEIKAIVGVADLQAIESLE